MPLTLIEKAGVNPYSDVLTEADFRKHFGVIRHPFTNMDYIQYYGDIIREYGKECEIIFANHPQDILKYTDAVLACDIHTRQHTKKVLNNNGARIVFGLDDILNHSVNGSGYNEQYGLLGSNKATEDKIKLFPHRCEPMLYEIQDIILRKTGKKVEVMVYGDKGTPVILVQGYFDNYTSD